jgi:hypothetical protein
VTEHGRGPLPAKWSAPLTMPPSVTPKGVPVSDPTIEEVHPNPEEYSPDDPPVDRGVAYEYAHAHVLEVAVGVLASMVNTTEHAHSADEAQYAAEQLALAARELTRATAALPASQRPVGWDDLPPGHAGTLEITSEVRLDAGTMAQRAITRMTGYPPEIRAVLTRELNELSASVVLTGAERLERVRRLAGEILDQ